ncbi:hypothetical protein BDW02DRAFT_651064 [Decorospora gaudefroyi]|uniref:Uncharacterized protein n=1 Tax=Decorospora gaudefroyi TaxID=184978 RepID=A0A6A5JY34_9PLEO|nr:hypothetical protein BDW02DRAFT_651064 [Decorospora gaudefroyi]
MTWCVGPPMALLPMTGPPYVNESTGYSTMMGGTGSCETMYTPIETTVCTTTLTGLGSKVPVIALRECMDNLGVAPHRCFTVQKATPVTTNGSLVTPAPTVKWVQTFWLAPWQSLTAGQTPSDVDVKICTGLDEVNMECVRYQEVWEVVVVTSTLTTQHTVQISTTVSGPGTLIVATATGVYNDTIESIDLSTLLLMETEIETESISSGKKPTATVHSTMEVTTTVFITKHLQHQSTSIPEPTTTSWVTSTTTHIIAVSLGTQVGALTFHPEAAIRRSDHAIPTITKTIYQTEVRMKTSGFTWPRKNTNGPIRKRNAKFDHTAYDMNSTQDATQDSYTSTTVSPIHTRTRTPTPKDNALATPSTNLYNLRINMVNSEDYISIYMPNSTASHFCFSADGQTAPDGQSNIYRLDVAVDAHPPHTLGIPVHGVIAYWFCNEYMEAEGLDGNTGLERTSESRGAGTTSVGDEFSPASSSRYMGSKTKAGDGTGTATRVSRTRGGVSSEDGDGVGFVTEEPPLRFSRTLFPFFTTRETQEDGPPTNPPRTNSYPRSSPTQSSSPNDELNDTPTSKPRTPSSPDEEHEPPLHFSRTVFPSPTTRDPPINQPHTPSPSPQEPPPNTDPQSRSSPTPSPEPTQAHPQPTIQAQPLTSINTWFNYINDFIRTATVSTTTTTPTQHVGVGKSEPTPNAGVRRRVVVGPWRKGKARVRRLVVWDGGEGEGKFVAGANEEPWSEDDDAETFMEGEVPSTLAGGINDGLGTAPTYGYSWPDAEGGVDEEWVPNHTDVDAVPPPTTQKGLAGGINDGLGTAPTYVSSWPDAEGGVDEEWVPNLPSSTEKFEQTYLVSASLIPTLDPSVSFAFASLTSPPPPPPPTTNPQPPSPSSPSPNLALLWDPTCLPSSPSQTPGCWRTLALPSPSAPPHSGTKPTFTLPENRIITVFCWCLIGLGGLCFVSEFLQFRGGEWGIGRKIVWRVLGFWGGVVRGWVFGRAERGE